MIQTILPHQLPFALDRLAGVKVLSLDCFDTLLWRDCHAPTDVFAALPETTALQRGWAESRARRAARLGRDRDEVTIPEIYAELMPGAPADARAAGVAAELAAEASACFAFRPAVALMRAARARGLKVVVVSDSYLDATSLRALIAEAAGADVAALIDRVFASSDFGKGKGAGLYVEVLRKLGVAPEQVLHIGDNHAADVQGVGRAGARTMHLVQFAPGCARRLRLEAAIGGMFHPRAGEVGALAAPQPHRAALATSLPQLAGDAEALGAAVLGPVLTAFDRWLRDEAAALGQRGGRVHRLFLMRDGYLPLRVHAAAAGDPGAVGEASALEISRFTATAASFDREAKVLAFVERELGTNPETLARQLLFSPRDAAAFGAGGDRQAASRALLREVRAVARQRAVVRASRAFARRLVAHVRATVNPARGDTLMLIDLGYNGSVQNGIDALLARELGVHVAGRYLLLRERDRQGLDKRGMIGSDHYDAHALEALCANVAVLEQLCTSATGSVIDYADDGAPIRRAVDITGEQSAVRERVQAGCLAFARAARDVAVRAAAPADAARRWREGAMAALARLMFLPLPEELAVIDRFEHDVNLGTGRTLALFDRAEAKRGLRERGLFYLTNSERMYLPAELAGGEMSPRLALLAQQRFGLPLTFDDHCERTLTLPLIHADRTGVAPGEVVASATHDGYFLAAIAIGECRYATAVRFGALYEWVEVASAFVTPVDTFLAERGAETATRVAVAGKPEGMVEEAAGLFRCEDAAGFLLFDPPPRVDDRAMLLAVVFRPIVARRAAPADAGETVEVATAA